MFNNFRTELKWGIIFVLASLLWIFLEKLAGLHDTHIDKHAFYTSFFALPAIAIYVFALLDKRKNDYHGVMTYRQGFLAGLIITLIIAALSPITQYITFTFVAHGYFENMIGYSVEHGIMTRDAAEDYFNLHSYIIQGLIGASVMGFLTTAVVAFFTKKTKTRTE